MYQLAANSDVAAWIALKLKYTNFFELVREKHEGIYT